MTVYELQHRFNLEVTKYGVIHPVLSTIVQDHINYAYQQYVTEKYDSLINPAEKFEITERISRILAPILDDFTESVTFTSITTNNPYGFYVTAPATLQYIIKDYANISTTDCDGNTVIRRARIIPMKHKYVESNKDNPFLKPVDTIDTEIWRLNYSGRKIELILSAGQTLVSYTCRYMKKLTSVDFAAEVTIEIDDSVHEEIVLRAVYMYLSDQRNNTKTE